MSTAVSIVTRDRFKSLIPPLSSEELAQLEANILAEGCRDPLVVWDTEDGPVLVDGHNRVEICNQHGIDFHTVSRDFDSEDEAAEWIIRNQFGRRNLPHYVRCTLALQLEGMVAARAKANQRAGGGSGISGRQISDKPSDTKRELAKIARVSHDTLAKVKKIEAAAPEEVRAKCATGEISINKAYSDIRRAENRVQRQETLRQQPLPSGTYGVIYADPPWRYEHSETKSRDIETQYPTMALDEICGLDIESMSAEDCVLYLWTTSPKVAESLQVVDAWGFNYRTCMVWVKDKIGMGYWARQRHELLLIATKGSPLTPDPSLRPDSVIESPRERHSQKPAQVRDMIAGLFPDMEMVELFQRSPTEGWEGWGNE